MNRTFCIVFDFLCRFIRCQTIREFVLYPDRALLDGPFVLAVTHQSHLEPIIVALHFRRRVRWMARLEFYRYRWSALLMRWYGTFAVNRARPAHSSIRTAVQLLRDGQIVGVFPEGGVANGPRAIFRGGPFKKGACAIARRANVPIVPVLVLGTPALNRIDPWLPAGRGRVWTAYGRPLFPPMNLPRREARVVMGRELVERFQALHQELTAAAGVGDTDVP